MTWMDDYEQAKRTNDRATRWSGGAGEQFPAHPEAFRSTTGRLLSQSEFGPTTAEMVNREPSSKGYERLMMSTVTDRSTDSMLGDVRRSESQLRDFEQFDESSPPAGSSRQEQVDNEIVSRVMMGKSGSQYTGTRGTRELLRESRGMIRNNPLRRGRN